MPLVVASVIFSVMSELFLLRGKLKSHISNYYSFASIPFTYAAL
jgi:hypothetical protein